MMMSISVASYHVGYSPGMPSVRIDFSHGLTGLRSICKSERTGKSFRELADGSLMFSFGESQLLVNLRAFHPPKKAKKANISFSSHVEQITAEKNPFLRRTSSKFKTKSFSISAEEKRNSARKQREQDVGSDAVQDSFVSKKVNEKTDNVNPNKRVYQPIQKSSMAYGKKSYDSVQKNGGAPAPKKSSVANDHVERILKTYIKMKSSENENSYNHLLNSKLENHYHPTRSVRHQYNEKTKEEFKEDASQRHNNHFPNSKIENNNRHTGSIWHQCIGKTKESYRRQYSTEGKVRARKFYSKREPQKTKYIKKTKFMDNSLSEVFLLSRPPSNFVRRSPIPSTAIKQDVRPVPGMKESKFLFSEKQSTGQDEGVLQDSEEMPMSVKNDSFVRDSLCSAEDKLIDSSEIKLVDLKIDGSKLIDLERTPMTSENGSVCRVLPSLSKDLPHDLSELKYVELKKVAKSYGLKGYSKLKKAEILDLLRNLRQF